ncbi:MAG: hypothetical protein GY720_14085 [bacterium]|nr:hypothetical protein [bacterium]
MKRAVVTCCLLALAIVVGACSGDGSEDTSTTVAPETTIAAVTSLEPTSTTEAVTADSTTTTSTTQDPDEPIEFPEYTIVTREEGDDGDTVVVLISDEASSLTDIDLANILADVVERFPPILTAHVVDHEDAVDAVIAAEPTAAQLEILDRNYLVRLEEGFRMIFTGPFAEVPPVILGS